LREGRVAAGREVDHIVPKAEAARRKWTRAQTDALSNLQCICRECHKAKTAADEGKVYRPKPRIGLDGWPVDG
jgi:5-methylcytosine-specific restriction protein A